MHCLAHPSSWAYQLQRRTGVPLVYSAYLGIAYDGARHGVSGAGIDISGSGIIINTRIRIPTNAGTSTMHG
jgi:hypothetical protein